MDGGRMENILQACGKLRIWLRPSTIHRFVRCIDYPLNNGHGTFEQFKTFIRNPHVIEAKLLNQDKQVQDAKDKNEETKEETVVKKAKESERKRDGEVNGDVALIIGDERKRETHVGNQDTLVPTIRSTFGWPNGAPASLP